MTKSFFCGQLITKTKKNLQDSIVLLSDQLVEHYEGLEQKGTWYSGQMFTTIYFAGTNCVLHKRYLSTFLCNILKINCVFPEPEGPTTAMKNLSLVEINLFIVWGWVKYNRLDLTE